jgi:hypothetical protein
MTLKQTEEQFQQAVIQYAQLMGWRVYHTRNSKGSEPGFPDLFCVRAHFAPNGICERAECVIAELKSGAKVTDDQRWWLAALDSIATNVRTYLWRPDDWPEINQVLGRRRVTPAAAQPSTALAVPLAGGDGGSAGRARSAVAGDARTARRGRGDRT